MNFNSLSKKEKLNIYEQVSESIHHQIFINLAKAGIDPITFSIDTFTYTKDQAFADIDLVRREKHGLMIGILLLIEDLREIDKKINKL